jgi:hypothetical protein
MKHLAIFANGPTAFFRVEQIFRLSGGYQPNPTWSVTGIFKVAYSSSTVILELEHPQI